MGGVAGHDGLLPLLALLSSHMAFPAKHLMVQGGCRSSSHQVCVPSSRRRKGEQKGPAPKLSKLPFKDLSWESLLRFFIFLARH